MGRLSPSPRSPVTAARPEPDPAAGAPPQTPQLRMGASLFGTPDGRTLGDYRLERTIGEGAFGKVKLATHLITGQQVAVKVVEKSHLKYDAAERLVREVLVLKLLEHPNINRLLEVVDTPAAVYLVLEYISGGELFDRICAAGRFGESDARAYFRQILSAVQYCHAHGVAHRDLKPENILVDKDGVLKLIDFGFSNLMRKGSHLDTFCGSAAYAAPGAQEGGEEGEGLLVDAPAAMRRTPLTASPHSAEMLSGKKYTGN
ncbi:MAG: kinase-like domain-containing protein, partial [Olpidium bornovanus]